MISLQEQRIYDGERAFLFDVPWQAIIMVLPWQYANISLFAMSEIFFRLMTASSLFVVRKYQKIDRNPQKKNEILYL